MRSPAKSLDLLTQPRPAGWVASATADNAVATATRAAAPAGKRHRITGVSASFAAASAGKLLEILDGTDVIWTGYVYDQLSVSFSAPIAGSDGGAVSARLAASGSLATLGAVNLTGYTE